MRLGLAILGALCVLAVPAFAGPRSHGIEPYFGGREYPDPYIVDGWRGDGGFRGHAYYAKTSPYVTRRHWPFYSVYEHRWEVADDIRSLTAPSSGEE
jgi:hypothetical protein